MAERRDVVGLDEDGATQVDLVGGKGAQLAVLRTIDGVDVPPGFVVTTAAFRRVVGGAPGVGPAVEVLGAVDPAGASAVRDASEAARRAVEAVVVPDDLVAGVASAMADIAGSGPALEGDARWAVRSSATTEDLAAASSAGQHDTVLDVVGVAAVVDAVRTCWASLFTERAVAYRQRAGIGADHLAMAVVVQRMVAARTSGVLFTADPLSGDRTRCVVEAVRGLGDALVAGRVRPETVRVRRGRVLGRSPAAGPAEAPRTVAGAARGPGPSPVLADAEAIDLVAVGRRIEAHLGCPQDVEWCLDDAGRVHVVQSRPITTLFPVPEVDDDEVHVYVSVGHQQMMVDAMSPLGLSVWQLTTPRPMHEAGSRLFVDVAPLLAAPASRGATLDLMGRSDPLIRDALETLLDRGDMVPTLPDGAPAPPVPVQAPPPIEPDPGLVAGLVEAHRASLAALARSLEGLSGPALVDAVLADVPEMHRVVHDPASRDLIMTAMEASWWLEDHLGDWLGDRSAVDRLSQAVPHDVTAEMGLALLDVADAVRPHPAAISLLEAADDDGFVAALTDVPGGAEAHEALVAFLDRFGRRGAAEIDIARPRWAEHPLALVPTILGHVRSLTPGEAARRVARGRAEAAEAEREVLARVRALPDGEARAAETARRIGLLRAFLGYREHPKYGMVGRYHLYRRALWAEAARLVGAGVLDEVDDVALLRIEELAEVVRTHQVDRELLEARRRALAAHRRLRPPRVLTSHGEALSGSYRRDDLAPGALPGLGVSAGVVEGRARVLHDIAEAELEAGDVLVTTSTDPSWTPAFVRAAALVTEVGGLMTHGAVVAREYGLPAVVGVEGATTRIADGRRIRVDGTNGTVELLGAT